MGHDNLLFEEFLVITLLFPPIFLAQHGLVVRVARLRLLENRLSRLLKLLHQLHVLRRDRRHRWLDLVFEGYCKVVCRCVLVIDVLLHFGFQSGGSNSSCSTFWKVLSCLDTLVGLV